LSMITDRWTFLQQKKFVQMAYIKYAMFETVLAN
jgi:hypothetical protein